MSEYYVSLSGKDSNPGSKQQPFATIAKGISVLKPGDILNLRQGTYVEPVKISNLHGTGTAPITIRSYPSERATIDGCRPKFLEPGAWVRASTVLANAHPDEYISIGPQDPELLNSGAFARRVPYTRLITYSNLNDLRAKNETFELIKVLDPKRPGPKLAGGCPDEEEEDELANVPPQGSANAASPTCYYPWVYMGPGLWVNPATRRVHIRLSQTHNQINGLADYKGQTNPNKVKLALAPPLTITLRILNSKHLHFENLTIRFGGDDTIFLRKVEGLVFDHVTIRAARHGVRMGGEGAARTRNTLFRHCDFDGGLPSWFFRSDRKREYKFIQNGQVRTNSLGKNTLDVLLLGSPNDITTQVEHCEFHDAHDLYLSGDVVFHHNWIDNLNDEALFLDAGTATQTQSFQLYVYQNVIGRSLSGVSFAGNHVKGNWYIYRNLIDLRRPTAGHRPRHIGDKNVWRFGHAFKSVGIDGPRDFFHNTVLVYTLPRAHADYRNYENLLGDHLRRTFNNIFVAVNRDTETAHALAFLPSPGFPGPTDGNLYYRFGFATGPLFRYLKYTFNTAPQCQNIDPSTGDHYCDAGRFANLDELRNPPSLLFLQSKSQYAPGYEAISRHENPQFCQIGTDGAFRKTDDLRLSAGSPAIGAGAALPAELQGRDPFALPDGTPSDIGCFPFKSEPLKVGIDGRWSYPEN